MKYQILFVGLLMNFFAIAQESIYNTGSFQIHEGAQIACFGDFQNDSTLTDNNGEFYLAGTGALQTLSGTGTFLFDSLVVNNENGIQVEQELKISTHLNFTNGIVFTNKLADSIHFIHFQSGSSYTGSSDLSFIDGVVKKTGNTSFTFPVGDESKLQAIHISSPDLTSDQFRAVYHLVDPDSNYSNDSIDITCLDHISQCEYWMLDRTNGTANVEVSLDYDASSCGVDDLCELLVARWNGTQWVSEGNGGVVGTTESGTVTTGDGCEVCGTSTEVTNFSPFTLGSSTTNNPLPVDFMEFTAHQLESTVVLNWRTKSEINNDFYNVERSPDGVNWNDVGRVKGAGNSIKEELYKWIDITPLPGISYYRLSQYDFDGKRDFLGIRSVNFKTEEEFLIQPNPSHGLISVYHENMADNILQIELYSANGNLISTNRLETTTDQITLDYGNQKPGVYYLYLTIQNSSQIKKIILL